MFRLSTNPSLTILKYFSFLHHFWLKQRLKLYPGDVIKSVLRCDSSLMLWTFSSDNKTNEFAQQIICINIFCQWKAPAQWTQFHKTIRLRLIFKLVLIRTIELPLNSRIKYFYLEKYLLALCLLTTSLANNSQIFVSIYQDQSLCCWSRNVQTMQLKSLVGGVQHIIDK